MLKVRNHSQVHIFRLDSRNQQLKGLHDLIRHTFTPCPPSFYLTYLDHDGDDIIVSSQKEWETILQLQNLTISNSRTTMLKLKVEDNSKEDENLEIHSDHSYQDHQFELLHSCEPSEYDELNSNSSSQDLEVLEDQSSKCPQQKIAELELLSQGEQDIQKRESQEREGVLIKEQVQSYIQTLEANVLSKIVQQELRDSVQHTKTVRLVEKSLQKLLPGFLDRLTKETVANVKQMLKGGSGQRR